MAVSIEFLRVNGIAVISRETVMVEVDVMTPSGISTQKVPAIRDHFKGNPAGCHYFYERVGAGWGENPFNPMS